MKKRLVVLALAGLAACSDSSGPEGETNISGTYTLRTINGQNLPFALIVVGTTYRLEMAAAQIVVNGNGSYSENRMMRETQGSTTTTQTDASIGTWTRANNAITFVQTSDGATVAGSLSDDTITIVDSDLTFVFRK